MTTMLDAARERAAVFDTYAEARRRLVAEGATHADMPGVDDQIFYRCLAGQRWEGCEARQRRVSGDWELSEWTDARPRAPGSLPFVPGLEGWAQ